MFNTIRLVRSTIIVCALSIVGLPGFSQKDTTRKQAIEITSTYKPVLRNTAKINFSANQPGRRYG
jgi:hypothetical protein